MVLWALGRYITGSATPVEGLHPISKMSRSLLPILQKIGAISAFSSGTCPQQQQQKQIYNNKNDMSVIVFDDLDEFRRLRQWIHHSFVRRNRSSHEKPTHRKEMPNMLAEHVQNIKGVLSVRCDGLIILTQL